MAEVLYEWNDLSAVHDHLAQGLERVELSGDVRAQIGGYLLSGRLDLSKGNLAAAEKQLEHVHTLLETAHFAHWISYYERLQVDFWLAQGELHRAVDWASAMIEDHSFARRAENEAAQLAMVWVLISHDVGSSQRVLVQLDSLLQNAAAEGRLAIQIQALTLQALARWNQGDPAAAMTALEHALRLAEPEGYLRLFVDFGQPVARLLQEARARAVRPNYVTQLLAGWGSVHPLSSPAPAVLPEPLTPREQEVLALLAAGLTNREIGEALVISPQTVKKHVSHIYGKLAVHSRREAITKAEEWALLA